MTPDEMKSYQCRRVGSSLTQWRMAVQIYEWTPPRNSGGIPSVSIIFSLRIEMSRLTRDGTAEPVSRDQILRPKRGQGKTIFPVQLTTSKIGNLTEFILTLLNVMTIHKPMMYSYRISLPIAGSCSSPRLSRTAKCPILTSLPCLTSSSDMRRKWHIFYKCRPLYSATVSRTRLKRKRLVLVGRIFSHVSYGMHLETCYRKR